MEIPSAQSWKSKVVSVALLIAFGKLAAVRDAGGQLPLPVGVGADMQPHDVFGDQGMVLSATQRDGDMDIPIFIRVERKTKLEACIGSVPPLLPLSAPRVDDRAAVTSGPTGTLGRNTPGALDDLFCAWQ